MRPSLPTVITVLVILHVELKSHCDSILQNTTMSLSVSTPSYEIMFLVFASVCLSVVCFFVCTTRF